MDWIKEYLLSIISAGIVCGICISLVPKNTSAGMVVKMLGGIILAIVLVAPLVKFRFDDIHIFMEDIAKEADSVAQEGSSYAQDALSSGIKKELETYILDKAESLGLALQVSIVLNHDNPPMPDEVRIRGAVSPYQKKVISEFLESELGITEAQQTWN